MGKKIQYFRNGLIFSDTVVNPTSLQHILRFEVFLQGKLVLAAPVFIKIEHPREGPFAGWKVADIWARVRLDMFTSFISSRPPIVIRSICLHETRSPVLFLHTPLQLAANNRAARRYLILISSRCGFQSSQLW